MNPQDAHFNPFPGLRPFQIEEKYLFFGREEQTARNRFGNRRQAK